MRVSRTVLRGTSGEIPEVYSPDFPRVVRHRDNRLEIVRALTIGGEGVPAIEPLPYMGCFSTLITCASMFSLRPSMEYCRPMPDSFAPPKGTVADVARC